MERNLRLYPAYQVARGAIFWLPVFFLLFSSHLPLHQVLQLEALYYVCVVGLEVPSGYMSDRLGRKPTLLIAMVGWTLAGVLFALGSGFWPFAVAQALLAAGMAFNSGTDSSLLYDSLAQLGRAEEIGAHESRAEQVSLLSMGAAALVGGALGAVDLRLAYVAFALSSAVALGIAWQFTEPERARAEAPLAQLGAVGRALRSPLVAWIFAFVVAMTVLNHVPYELAQPYLEALVGEVAALVSGVLVAATLIVSAFAGGRASRLAQRVGTTGGLLAAGGLQLVVIGAMAVAVHPALVPVLLLRSVPGALIGPISRAALHPLLSSGVRATFLSVQSLAGRLAFSLSLAVASGVVGGVEASPEVLRALAAGFLLLGAVLLGGLALARLGGGVK